MGTLLDKRVTQIINNLIEEFWKNWDRRTCDFPDTEDASEIKLRILQISVIGVVTNYIMGHKPEFQDEEVDKMIEYIDGIRDLIEGDS